MCVALPGKVMKKEGDYAIVDFSGNTVRAFSGLCAVEPGDRVLVHAGCILQVVTQSQAEETEEILKDMEEMFSMDPVFGIPGNDMPGDMPVRVEGMPGDDMPIDAGGMPGDIPAGLGGGGNPSQPGEARA